MLVLTRMREKLAIEHIVHIVTAGVPRHRSKHGNNKNCFAEHCREKNIHAERVYFCKTKTAIPL